MSFLSLSFLLSFSFSFSLFPSGSLNAGQDRPERHQQFDVVTDTEAPESVEAIIAQHEVGAEQLFQQGLLHMNDIYDNICDVMVEWAGYISLPCCFVSLLWALAGTLCWGDACFLLDVENR